jgi:hypothetical protein
MEILMKTPSKKQAILAGIIFLGVVYVISASDPSTSNSPAIDSETPTEAPGVTHTRIRGAGQSDQQSADHLPAFTPGGTPIDPHAAEVHLLDLLPLATSLSIADKAIAVVRNNGYRCDSLLGLAPWLTSAGFTLYCGLDYKYEFRDVGQGYTFQRPQ